MGGSTTDIGNDTSMSVMGTEKNVWEYKCVRNPSKGEKRTLGCEKSVFIVTSLRNNFMLLYTDIDIFFARILKSWLGCFTQ